jgi:Tol biopolymer transport system component
MTSESKKLAINIWLFIIFLSGCGPGQIFGSTITPIPTKKNYPTYSITPIPTYTSSTTASLTHTQTPTQTPFPLGHYVIVENDGDKINIVLCDETGARIRTLSAFTTDASEQFTVAWSPSGDYLMAKGGYFEGPRGRIFYDLYLISYQDGQAVRIAKRIDEGAIWSLKGDTIAYTAPLPQTDNNSDIYIYDVKSSQTMRLTKDAANNWFPEFTPGGEHILYWNHGWLRIISLDGSTNYGIAQSHCWWGEYEVTPDGRKIVYSEINGQVSDIFLIDIEGKNRVQLTTDKIMDDRITRGFKNISPDGNYVIYHSYGFPNGTSGSREPSEGEYISVMPLDGSGPILLGTGDGWDAHWSIDGQFVIFHGWLGKKRNSDISPGGYFAVHPDGTNVISLSEDAYNRTLFEWQLNYISINTIGQGPFRGNTITPTYTPWQPIKSLVMYDDFSNQNLDLLRWNKTSWISPEKAIGSYFSYKIMDGKIFLEVTSPAKQASGLDLEMIQPATRSIANMKAIEAEFYLLNGSHGINTDAHLRINTTISDHLWWAQCRLAANLEGTAANFICEVKNDPDNPELEFQTIERPIKFSDWYTIRIEMDPQSGALQFFLNGELIEQYLPKDANLLKQARFQPAIGVSASRGSVDAFIDNVQISP